MIYPYFQFKSASHLLIAINPRLNNEALTDKKNRDPSVMQSCGRLKKNVSPINRPFLTKLEFYYKTDIKKKY